MLIFPNTFYRCHFNTSNQIENEAIEHIFETYLVRSDEVANLKSVWKNCLRKIPWAFNLPLGHRFTWLPFRLIHRVSQCTNNIYIWLLQEVQWGPYWGVFCLERDVRPSLHECIDGRIFWTYHLKIKWTYRNLWPSKRSSGTFRRIII